MEELLSLKWNNHRSTFLHILAVLRDKQLYSDVTLACDGKLYSVHKLVLSTCSDYFSSMLDRTTCKCPVIVLKDIKSEDLEALLDYMYLGEVNVRQSDLSTLIKAAECLRVKGLAVPDDEPPAKKTREAPSRRGDTSSSPPAKRKRRSDVDDGRDDVRPAGRTTSPRHSGSSPSSKPKTSSGQNSSSHVNNLRNSSNSVNSVASKGSNEGGDSSQVKDNVDSNDISEIEPLPQVKVELDDSGGGGDGGGQDNNDLSESYSLGNEEFKEEGDDADLSSDLPEFLEQAAGNYPNSSYAGQSYQSDLSWQGGTDGGSGGASSSFPSMSYNAGGGQEGTSQQGEAAQMSSMYNKRTGLFGRSDADSLPTGLSPDHTRQHQFVSINATSLLDLSGGGDKKLHPRETATVGESSSSALYDSVLGHEEVSKRSCSVCGHVAHGRNWRQDLSRHMRTHTGEKPYLCPFCSHRATRSTNLRMHLIRIHSLDPNSASTYLRSSIREQQQQIPHSSSYHSEAGSSAAQHNRSLQSEGDSLHHRQ